MKMYSNMLLIESAIIIFFISLETICVDVKPKNGAEDHILKFFDKWRNCDIHTLPFSLPCLHNITMPPTKGSYSGKGLKITFASSEINVIGFDNFSVTELDVPQSAMQATGSLWMPSLLVIANEYSLQGRAFYVYSLNGSGKLNITLSSVRLKFGVKFASNGKETKVNELQLDFSVENIKANLENSSWPVNKLLNTEGVKILDQYHDEIISATRTDLVDKFDKYFATVTPVQLLDKIWDS